MSSLEGLRANWEVGRVAKEDASSEYSESEAKPPNPRLLIGWPYGGTRLLEAPLLLAAGSSIRGRRWNWKSEEGEGGHERKCKLCSRYRVCVSGGMKCQQKSANNNKYKIGKKN